MHQLRGIPGVTMSDNYTGNGVSELINLCMQALLDNGDEILIPAPDYPLWTATATLASGECSSYTCDEQSEWNPDIDDIKKQDHQTRPKRLLSLIRITLQEHLSQGDPGADRADRKRATS